MAHVASAQHGTLLVEGKTSHVFHLSDRRRVKGHDLLTRADWAWRESLHLPGVRYTRLRVSSPTSGLVTAVIVGAPGRERYSLLCRDTTISAPCLIRAWQRRSWMEPSFRTRNHLLATAACPVQTADAYNDHLILRL
jgi:hypothetical protein